MGREWSTRSAELDPANIECCDDCRDSYLAAVAVRFGILVRSTE